MHHPHHIRPAATLVASLLVAWLSLAATVAGCAAESVPRERVGASIDPTTLEFPEVDPIYVRSLREAVERFLTHRRDGEWSQAYDLLDAASKELESPDDYVARHESPSVVTLLDYTVEGVTFVPGYDDLGVARVELRVLNRKSEETWVEHLWLVREGDAWFVSPNLLR
ncbi:MAG: hypothetical protein KKA32_03315 [Actinobacteria bacterium]|nr:hypothetical protein [Actinomycetota bacterium]